jgi:hypothetical protein
MVKRSNADMSNYYDMAAFDYPDIFHFPKAIRAKTKLSAQTLMSITLMGLTVSWIVLYLVYFCLDNPLGIKPFL